MDQRNQLELCLLHRCVYQRSPASSTTCINHKWWKYVFHVIHECRLIIQSIISTGWSLALVMKWTTGVDSSMQSHIVEQVLPKVILEDCYALAQLQKNVPIGYNGTPQIHPQKCPFSFDDDQLSNTPIPRPTPLTTPNGIRINSAVLPQYTFQTDRQTNRQTDGLTLGENLIESDALIINIGCIF